MKYAVVDTRRLRALFPLHSKKNNDLKMAESDKAGVKICIFRSVTASSLFFIIKNPNLFVKGDCDLRRMDSDISSDLALNKSFFAFFLHKIYGLL